MHPFLQQNYGLLGHGPAIFFRFVLQPFMNIAGYILYQ